MFTVVWTEDILAETLHAVRRPNPNLEGGKDVGPIPTSPQG